MVSTTTKKDESTSSSIPSVLNFDSQNQGGQHQQQAPQSRSRNRNKGAADSLDTLDHVVGDNSNSNNNNSDDFVWYFGYGPICHPQVRARRSIVSQNHQACVLRDYRLTFAFGGAATLVPAMGFTVHGVLMQIARHDGTEEIEDKKDAKPSSWKRLQDFDAGYSVQTVQVVPYTYTPQLDFDDDFFDDHEDQLQDCFAFVMLDEYDENLLEQNDNGNLEKKPQERYLRLIAQGMLQTGVSPDYVNDEILAVPFVPTRSEAEWISFPSARARLPKISFAKYQRLCARVQNEPEVFFVLNRHVLRLVLVDPSDPQYDPTRNMGKDKRRKSHRRSQRITTAAGGVCKESSHSQTASTTTSQAWNNNPSVQWMKQNAHGAGDLTHISHVIVTDPAVPWAPTPADLTDLHYRWAENQMYDFLMQSNVSAEKVYQLVDNNNNNNKNKDKVENKETSKKPPSRRLSLWARKLGCVVPGRVPAPEEDDSGAATAAAALENNDKGHHKKDDDNNRKDPSQNNNGSSATELLREETTSRSNATAPELLPHPSPSSQENNIKDEEHGCANHETNEQHEVVGLGNVEREIMRRTAEKASVQHFTPVSSRHFHQEENVGNDDEDDREEKKQNNDVEVLGEGTTTSFPPADTILETDNETNAVNPTVEAVS